MAGCGLRVSEVVTLKVEHLDDAGGYLHVVNDKGGKQRTYILPKPVLEALNVHLQGRQSDLAKITSYFLNPSIFGLNGKIDKSPHPHSCT
jgi:integrase